jgi:hypothetical protein
VAFENDSLVAECARRVDGGVDVAADLEEVFGVHVIAVRAISE